jgi:hypothetical protein
MPTIASADRASAALEELTEALKDPAAAKPFLNTGNKLNAAIKALTEILSKRSTTPPNSEASPPRVSEGTVRTPRTNTAHAGWPLLENDPKQALRGLNKIINMGANPTLDTTNNIKKTTSILTKLVNNNNNINDNNNNNNNINGVDNITPGEKNNEENNPRRRLRKIIIPKPQKLKLNTTVYKIFEDKIHQGYICEIRSEGWILQDKISRWGHRRRYRRRNQSTAEETKSNSMETSIISYYI